MEYSILFTTRGEAGLGCIVHVWRTSVCGEGLNLAGYYCRNTINIEY